MPSLQLIHASITQLNFAHSAVKKLHEDLLENELSKSEFLRDNGQTDSQLDIKLDQKLTVKDASFAYSARVLPALRKINLEIISQSRIGIIGATGSGKSTLLDLILGLISAQKGQISIDGQQINETNAGAWKKNVGYVPQHFILNTTLAENIAFGILSD